MLPPRSKVMTSVADELVRVSARVLVPYFYIEGLR